MASFRKNPNGTYTGTVYVGRDADGKMLREYVTRDTLKEAKAAAREIENDIASRDLSKVGKMKMSKYMDVWMDINKPFLAPTTIKSYKGYIKNHFKGYFGSMVVNQVTDIYIKDYMAKKLLILSPTTVRKHYFVLQKMFREALKNKSPCIGVKPPKENDYKPVLLTEKQFVDIRNAFAAVGPEHEAVILLAGWNGMRRGEIFALKDDDIDEENGLVRVDEALALKEEDYTFELTDPKSDRGIRDIATPDYLIELLLKIIEKNKKKRIAKQKKSKKVVSLSDKRADAETAYPIFSITPSGWSGLYTKVVTTKNLPKVRFHDLRHYHASFLYKNKVPDLYAAERLGHDIWVLKKIYQHLGLEERKNMDDKVRNLLNDPK